MENRPPDSQPGPQRAVVARPTPADTAPARAATGMGVVLMSLLAYPGSGHLILKEPRRGAAWAIAFTFSLVASIGYAGANLYHLYGNVDTMNEVPDWVKMWAPCFALMLLCAGVWVGSALDAFLILKRRPPQE